MLRYPWNSVADPGFGRGAQSVGGPPNFETGRIYAWFYRELCQTAQNVCSTLGLGGPGLRAPPGSATETRALILQVEVCYLILQKTRWQITIITCMEYPDTKIHILTITVSQSGIIGIRTSKHHQFTHNQRLISLNTVTSHTNCLNSARLEQIYCAPISANNHGTLITLIIFGNPRVTQPWTTLRM